jgi:acyl-CoA reductase-like NAD-dependent aldehyde dehydrogenase
LSQEPVKAYIGGKWTPASDGATFKTLDPGDGSVLATVAACSAADVD